MSTKTEQNKVANAVVVMLGLIVVYQEVYDRFRLKSDWSFIPVRKQPC